MYQSLHTTLIASNGQPFEIQIRTYEMHRTAEYGIAAHWKYKEGKSGETGNESEEAKLSWLRQILEWQKEMSDNKEFYRLLKMTSICFRTVCTALHHPVMSKIFRQVPVRSILHTVSTVLSVIRWSVQESMESLSILIIRLRAVTGLRLLHHRIPKDRAVTG